jgi:hypothetical protein
MTVGNVLVNDTVRIKVRFVDIDSSTGEQVDVSPTLVAVRVYDSDNVQIVNTTATSLTASQYYYDYTPSEAGEYRVTFIGTMPDTTYITVNQQLYVSTPTDEYKPVITLGHEEIITFAPDVDPLYLNPEELQSYFPEASLMEIGEIVHFYSLEVKQLYSYNDDITGADLNFTTLEYIKAATACELSRTYSYGGDDDVSISLGDLSISSRSLPRSQITRGNATTWCQIAAALRKEMLTGKVGPKGFQPKGIPTSNIERMKNYDPQTGKTIYLGDRDLYGPGERVTMDDDPMPKRGLRSYD